MRVSVNVQFSDIQKRSWWKKNGRVEVPTFVYDQKLGGVTAIAVMIPTDMYHDFCDFLFSANAEVIP